MNYGPNNPKKFFHSHGLLKSDQNEMSGSTMKKIHVFFVQNCFLTSTGGVPKKRTFRIAIKSSLKSILGLMTRVWPAVLKAADWQAILKVVFLGHPVYIFRKSQMNYGPKTQLKMFTRFLKKKSCNFNPLTPSHILLCSFKIWVDVSVSFVLQVLVRLFFL